MGLDVYGRLIFGVQIWRNDLFKPTGTRRQCIKCLRVANETEKHCPNDGVKISVMNIDEPTPAFEQFAAVYKTYARQLWAQWRDIAASEGPELAVHICDAMQGGDERDPSYALGYLVGYTKSHRSGRNDVLTAVEFDSLKEKIPPIQEAAKALGFPETLPIKIFHCIYLSY